jgi:SAM-dependent methyltransferase
MKRETTAQQRFIEEYRKIRYAEGWGSNEPSYYRALPFQDLSGRNAAVWAMRARTLRHFENRILRSVEKAAEGPLDILDLGAGNCWLSYRLSLRQHRVFAVDIFVDSRDGLLAARHYGVPLAAVAADFDHLPFPPARFDMIVFNASIHYSTDYQVTLSEARQCLRPHGRLVILDSPVYGSHEHGLRMVAERQAGFEKRYGFRSDAVATVGFLDEPGLLKLASSLDLHWEVHRPWYGWRWHTRPLKAWLQGRRPPSRFWIWEGRFGSR